MKWRIKMLVYKINEELTIKRHCEELVLYLFDDEIAKEKYIDDPTATDYLTFKMLDIFLKDYKKYNEGIEPSLVFFSNDMHEVYLKDDEEAAFKKSKIPTPAPKFWLPSFSLVKDFCACREVRSLMTIVTISPTSCAL